MKLTTLFSLLLLVACSINRLDEAHSTIDLRSGDPANPAIISVEKGPSWAFKFTPGPFVIWVHPQMAFWLEDSDGTFLRTLYVTGAGEGQFKNNAGKNEREDAYFAEMLPVWSSRVLTAGEMLPTREQPYLDGVTSATPQSSFDLAVDLGVLPDSFRVVMEINRSADTNRVFSEERTDWIGQPSLIYAVELSSLEAGGDVDLRPIGRGRLPGGPDAFIPDLDGMDSALDLVSRVGLRRGTGGS